MRNSHRWTRRYLPAVIRRPLGNLFGNLQQLLWKPFLGFIFDLRGGRFHANGCVFEIPKDITTRSFRSCFLTDAYEIDERRLVSRFVQPDDQVLELGGCLGIVSCIANKRLGDPTRHLVVEANPDCLPGLCRNRELNSCAFAVENCAVCDQPDITFFPNSAFIVSGTTKEQSERSVRVTGKSLKQLFETQDSFSVLIMDIEGSELETLESSMETLKRFRLVIIELHDWLIGADGVARCREILCQSGFQMAEQSFITEAWIRK